MSKILAGLLDKPEEAVADAIDKLEAKAGYPSEDARLIANTSQQVRAKIVELGLDPHDTTSEELYHALIARFNSDADHLDKALDIDTDTPLDAKIKKAIDLARHLTIGSTSWSLKATTAKRILRQLPPKKLMKALSYRSVDSLLKRENPATLFIAAKLLESPTWQKNMAGKLSRLASTDFEMRPVQIVNLGDWHSLRSNALVAASAELAAVGILPSRQLSSSRTLAIALSVADSINAVATQHKGLSLAQVSPSLGWWVGAEHLLAWQDGQPVSLNIIDIAANHTTGKPFEQRQKSEAAKSLWNELIDGYKKHLDELPEELAEIDNAASDKLRKLMAPATEMAEELVEA